MAFNTSLDFELSNDESHYTFNKVIEKSNNDDRSYRIIRLFNDLEVLIISDNNTDVAAAAMNIGIGSYCDPDKLLGLAHYCEHLLFMGTQKFPKVNEFSEYLKSHNGTYNAFTSDENTNFFFEVGNLYLEPALDRFSQFFKNPLFNINSAEKELKIIDSGYLQSDVWRINQLQRFLSNPKHPYSRFTAGNLETLMEIPARDGIDARMELIKWYYKHYSANVMKLCILGSDSLEKLTKLVVEKFSDIQNNHINVKSYVELPLRNGIELSKVILVRPVKDFHRLEVSIPIPNQRKNYKAKAAYYVSYLMNSECVGSISSLLKSKGWITYFGVGPHEISVDFHLMVMIIYLSEDGLEHYEDVLEIIFQYIEMIRMKGPQENLYKEMKSLNELRWRFMEKSWELSYANELANRLHKPYSRDKLLSTHYTEAEFNAEIISDVFENLRIENSVITIASKLLKGLNVKEKWFQAEYTSRPISELLVKKLKDPIIHPDLKICKPNIFIPTNFNVNRNDNIIPKSRPDIIMDNDFYRIWYKKDDKWWIPKLKIEIAFKTPMIKLSALNTIAVEIYCNLFNDEFAGTAYEASLSGISGVLHAIQDSLIIKISGFNDKALILLKLMVEKMKRVVINELRFNVVREKLKRYYNNKKLNSPASLSSAYNNELLNQVYFSTDDYLFALEIICINDVLHIINNTFNQFFVEALVIGNISINEVKSMVLLFDENLKPKMTCKSQIIKNRRVLLPKGKKFFFQGFLFNKNELNNAIRYDLQCGEGYDKDIRIRLKLIAQILQELSFNILRTKEQLGYSVDCYSIENVISIYIQSEKDPMFLENRIEEFLINGQVLLENLTNDEYEMQKNSLIDKLLVKDKNMWHEALNYSYHINNGYYDFHKNHDDSDAIKLISKDKLLRFYEININPQSKLIRKLSVHVRSLKNESQSSLYALSDDNFIINDIVKFKNSMYLGQPPIPVADLQSFYSNSMIS